MQRTIIACLLSFAGTLLASCEPAATTDSNGEKLNRYFLEMSSAGSGTGRISASPAGGEYVAGTIVTVTATPDSGSHFIGWNAVGVTAACVQPVNPCTAQITGRKSAVAMFVSAVGAQRFDGEYVGTITPTGSAVPLGVITLTIANGSVQGTAGVQSANLTLSGAVSAAGVLNAAAPHSGGGICPATTVAFTGQLTTSFISGITTAVGNGSLGTQESPPRGCSLGGTWTANRRTVPREATSGF